MTIRRLFLFLGIVSLALHPVPCSAQEVTGTIAGMVMDDTNAVIPDAAVEAQRRNRVPQGERTR